MRNEGFFGTYEREINPYNTQMLGDTSKKLANKVPQIIFGIVWQVMYTKEDVGERKHEYVGAIKFVQVDQNTPTIDEKMLKEAYPLNRLDVNYPVKGEPVIIINIFGKFYYITLVSINDNINNNINSTIARLNSTNLKSFASEKYSKDLLSYLNEHGNPNNEKERIVSTDQQDSQDKRLDLKFIRDDDILPLMPFPGHKILQGRWGNSIRIGRINDETKKDYRPNIKIRVHGNTKEDANGELNNKDKKHEFLGVEENILKDGNSIWITCGEKQSIKENVDFSPYYGPKENKNFGDKKDENLIQIKSDKIISFATEDYQIISMKNTFLGNRGKFVSSTFEGSYIFDKKEIELNSPKVWVGKGALNSVEFIPKGKTLLELLIKLTDALQNHIHPTPAGPSGPPLPPALMTFTSLSTSEWKTIEQRESFVPTS